MGIPNALQSRVWDYAFTTSRATVSVPDSLFMAEHDLTVRPLGGEGFGLPMVRVYANYFGGVRFFQHASAHAWVGNNIIACLGTLNITPHSRPFCRMSV